jgi:hypothetical protein
VNSGEFRRISANCFSFDGQFVGNLLDFGGF